MENHFNCIYCYTNKVNGKKYVGKTVDFNKRHKQHINQAYNENHRAYGCAFHCAIRKYGIENFEIKILIENLQNQEELNYWECYYIVEFDTLAKNGKGYNLASGGEGGNTLAGKTDEEMKEISKKLTEVNKKHWENLSNEERESFKEKLRGENNPMYNKHHTKEARKKMSEKRKGENNSFYGKTHSEETKQHLKEIHIGKIHSEETCKKISKNSPRKKR